MKSARRLRKPKAPTLSERVQKSRDPEAQDTIDPDVQGYLASFFKEFSSLQPLESFNLLTQESAVKALEMLDQTQKKVDAQLKTARALKGLLKNS